MNIGIQYKQLEEEIDKTMKEIAQSSRFVLGKETENFEQDICKYCNVKYAIGVASGTDALILALTALDIKTGDEVITTPFTFIATAEAITRVGAKPVFVDIDPGTYNIEPAKIEKAGLIEPGVHAPAEAGAKTVAADKSGSGKKAKASGTASGDSRSGDESPGAFRAVAHNEKRILF